MRAYTGAGPIAKSFVGPVAVCLVLAWDRVEPDPQHRSEAYLSDCCGFGHKA